MIEIKIEERRLKKIDEGIGKLGVSDCDLHADLTSSENRSGREKGVIQKNDKEGREEVSRREDTLAARSKRRKGITNWEPERRGKLLVA